jgi:hypothetical protein
MLERKDFRGKLDPRWHELMRAVADADGVGDGEWIEALIVRELQKRVHAASLIDAAARRAGISGNDRESPGMSGNGRE